MLIADRNDCTHDPKEVAEMLDGLGDRFSEAIGESLHDAADVVRGLAARLKKLETSLEFIAECWPTGSTTGTLAVTRARADLLGMSADDPIAVYDAWESRPR